MGIQKGNSKNSPQCGESVECECKLIITSNTKNRSVCDVVNKQDGHKIDHSK